MSARVSCWNQTDHTPVLGLTGQQTWLVFRSSARNAIICQQENNTQRMKLSILPLLVYFLREAMLLVWSNKASFRYIWENNLATKKSFLPGSLYSFNFLIVFYIHQAEIANDWHYYNNWRMPSWIRKHMLFLVLLLHCAMLQDHFYGTTPKTWQHDIHLLSIYVTNTTYSFEIDLA